MKKLHTRLSHQIYLMGTIIFVYAVSLMQSFSEVGTGTYDGTSLPEQSAPEWTLNTSGSTSSQATIVSGKLRLETPSGTDNRSYEISGPSDAWNADLSTLQTGSKLIIETSMRTISMASGSDASSILYFANGTKDYRIYFSPTHIRFGDTNGSSSHNGVVFKIAQAKDWVTSRLATALLQSIGRWLGSS